MTPLDKLIAHFERFPGTGLRQARRFAFHVLTLKPDQITELASLITSLQQSVVECNTCHRFFSESGLSQNTCSICRDQNRDQSKLLIVARDTDIEAIERSGVYDGVYFILGGTVSLLANPKDEQRVRSGALKALVTSRLEANLLKEIILGFAINADGENTGRFVENLLSPLLTTTPVTITHLGRGLSTGSELEYADAETIKSALQNRTK
jgi:recombination protein RecR